MRDYPITGSFLIFCLFSQAYAEDDKSVANNWSFGPAIKVSQSPYVGGDSFVAPSFASITEKRFLSRGPILPFKQTDRHQYFVGFSFSDWNHNRGDSAELADMSELDLGVNLRFGSAWRTQSGVTDVEILQDVSAHKSAHARLRHTYDPEGSNNVWKPFAEVQWLPSDLTDYYVGVNANDVKAGRPAYEADADFAVKAGVKMEYALSERMTFVGSVELTHFGDEVGQSPIIAENNIFGGSLGLSYQWK